MGYETELTELSGPSGKTFRVYEDTSGDIQVEVGGTYVSAGLPMVTAEGGQRIVISASAPSDADGRPDGTIYIQTA